jgi:hypothetical protein
VSLKNLFIIRFRERNAAHSRGRRRDETHVSQGFPAPIALLRRMRRELPALFPEDRFPFVLRSSTGRIPSGAAFSLYKTAGNGRQVE